MAINLVDGFNVTVNKPLDERLVTDDLTTLNAIPVGVRYVGMSVYVTSEKAEYKWEDGVWKLQGSLSGYATEEYADNSSLVHALVFG